MRSKAKTHGGGRNALINTGVVAGSILAFLLFCELVIFRLIFTPSDVPANIYIDGLVRLTPASQGIWRVGNDVAAPYRINAQGWNSAHASYAETPPPDGVKRIAIIGDSFVEALQVPFDASLAEQLERSSQGALQVYRFGISGAPLSHYLQMARTVARIYRPDMVVLVLVHNDFDESFNFVPGRYTSSFQKFRTTGSEVVGEIAPEPYQPGWRDWVRQSAIMRYLYYRQKLTPSTLATKLRGDPLHASPAGGEVAMVVSQKAVLQGAADYAVAQFKALATGQNFRPLLIMDGDRQAIYSGLGPAAGGDNGALWLNRMTGQVAAQQGVPLIDLHPQFTGDWQEHQKRFEFAKDPHWNVRGHAIAAAAIRAYLAQNPL